MEKIGHKTSNEDRARNPDDVPDGEIKDLYAYGAGLQSLSDIVGLYRFANLEFLSLHGNRIECMQGLEELHLIKELNLSSNNIKRMECISHLSQLRVLNLSCNQIEEIMDVQGLLALEKLLLPHNRISCLGGLSVLHGPRYSLKLLDLRDNIVSSLSELDVLAGCVNLMELTFLWGNHSNPVCQHPAYKSAVVAAVPHIRKLDGETLCSRPWPGYRFQDLSTPGGNGQDRNATPLLPVGPLQYKFDCSQDPYQDRLESAVHADADQSQSWQVFLPPQAHVSKYENHQNRWPKKSHFGNCPQNDACLDHGQFQYKTGLPAVQPCIAHSCLHHDVRAFPSHGSGQGTICHAPQAPEWQSVSHVETPNWVNEPSASHLLSMASLSHPAARKTSASSDLQTLCAGGGLGVGDSSINRSDLPPRKLNYPSSHMGRNPHTGIVQGVLNVAKVDRSNQTDHGAWLGALEEKILDLVQQIPSVKTCAQEETVGHSGDDDAQVLLQGSKFQRVDWRGTLSQHRRKRKGCDSEFQEVVGESSSGDTSDSDKSSSKSLCRPVLSSGGSGSQSPKYESPTRRWVHFGDKSKRKKDLSRSGRNSGREVDVPEDYDAVKHSHVEDLRRLGGKSGTGQDNAEDRKTFKQLCEEVKNLQAGLASLTSTFMGVGVEVAQMTAEKQPEKQAELIPDQKEATLCKLMEDCTLLENKLINSEEIFSKEKNDLHRRLESEQEERNDLRRRLESEQEERNDLNKRLVAEQEGHKDLRKRLEAKEATICELEKMLQDKDQKGLELSRQIRQFTAERGQKELLLKEKYHGKFLALSTELVSLKEALNVATCARQNAESALLDATAETENRRQLAISVGQALDEERRKLQVCKSELEACRSHGLVLQEEVDKSSKNFSDAQIEKQKALQELSKIHKQEMEEAIARESAAGESRGMSVAGESFVQLRNAMNLKLMNAQKGLQEAHQETLRIRQDMDNMREEKGREEAALKETIRKLLLKEQGKEELVVELSSVVRSQKMKLQAVQLDLERLAEAEEDVHKMHQEMIIVRRRADKYDELVLEVESLHQKLIEVANNAERQKESQEEKFHGEILSLQKEKKRLTTDLEKVEALEDAVKVKNKMLDSQNESIKELKFDLSQAKEAFRKALKTSEVLETEWTSRLQVEVDQGEALQDKLAKQALTMTALEEKMRLERAAKLAAENTSMALQENLSEKEDMLRYVEEEILQVKEMYDSRVRAIGIERDRALETAKQEKEHLEKVLADAQREQQVLLKSSKSREALLKADTTEKDLQLARASQRVVEMEAELKSQCLAMESQKTASVSKLDQLHKLLEELRDGN